MYRAALQTASRQALGASRAQIARSATRRLASTASSPAANRPRSWKSAALRWGLVLGAVYYYNTSPVFAEEMADTDDRSNHPPSSFADSEPLPTVESLVGQKRQQSTEADQQAAAASATQPGTTTSSSSSTESSRPPPAATPSDEQAPDNDDEQGAHQEAAFNPETGEINWDCPCLGGMAHGPCGEQFKAAFGCFVYSNEEPKGMDCIDKFQAMQACFRDYPDIYGAELDDDDDDDYAEGGAPAAGQGQLRGDEARERQQSAGQEHFPKESTKTDTLTTGESTTAEADTRDGVPKRWEDATNARDTQNRHARGQQPGEQKSKE